MAFERVSLRKKREIARKMSEPGSFVQEMSAWHRRNGAGPVPKAVKRAVKRYIRVRAALGPKHREILARHKD